MRNENGFGTINKLSGKRRKPYQALITLGFEKNKDTGLYRQVRKSLGCYATKSEAIEALVNYKKSPFDIAPNIISFEEVYQRWSRQHFKKLSNSAINGYKSAFNNCSILHKRKMAELRIDDLQYALDNSGKNAPTQQNMKKLFSQMYSYAVVHDICTQNQKDKLHYLEINADNPNSIERHIFTESELEALWNNYTNYEYSEVILILIYTGCRISELLNLKKENVHMSERYFDITASKTSNGIRRIPICDKIYPFFESWYSKDSEYLLSTDKGKRLSYDVFYRLKTSYWHTTLKALDIDYHTPHDTSYQNLYKIQTFS